MGACLLSLLPSIFGEFLLFVFGFLEDLKLFEKMPLSHWSVGKSVGHFLDPVIHLGGSSSRQEGGATLHQVVQTSHGKQAKEQHTSKVF